MGRRVIVVVLDGLGAGHAPDAADFGDEGANTLGNTARAVSGLEAPNLASLGLGNLEDIEGIPPTGSSRASHGLMAEHSAAKATLAGHWEMMGLVLERPAADLSGRFPRRSHPAFRGRDGAGGHRQQTGIRDGDHRGAGSGSGKNGLLDPLHLRRLGLPARRPHGRDPTGRTLRSLRKSPRNAHRQGRHNGRAGHSPSIPRRRR